MQTMTACMQRFERRIQVLTALVVAQGAVLATLLMGGAGDSPPSMVSARQFRLMDDSGRTRAEWRCTADGPVFTLIDAGGTDRLMLAQSERGVTAAIADSTGTDRARITVTDAGPA